jgi:dTDP-4-amino-4,6-dideoxygalactose transaminase
MDPGLLEKAVEELGEKGIKPRAVIPVHLYGMPARIDRIRDICNLHGIPIIEDAAEALGSEYNGRNLGTFGDYGILSFNGNKIITTSGGGALVCPNKELADKARFYATQSRDPAPHYQHSVVGYNYRMSNVLAGIGRGQMQVLPGRVRQRRKMNEFYRTMLEGQEGITFLREPGKEYYSNFWLSTILIDPAKTKGIDREKLRLALEEENIESRPLWKPLHQQPVFSDCPVYLNGTSDIIFEQGLCLPSGTDYSSEELDRISTVLEDTMKG